MKSAPVLELPLTSQATPLTFVLTGASNLARGYYALSRCLRDNLRPRRVRFLTALGPGRGYVAYGGMFHLRYPPIQESPIFKAAHRHALRGEQVVGFLTDIGNDLLYNITGQEITRALDSILQRLEDCHAHVFATPIHPVLEEILTPEVYSMLRTWLYPRSQVTYEQVIDGLRCINRYLDEAQAQGRLHLIEGMEAFLGWDYVHYGLMRATGAWTRAADGLLHGMGLPCRRPVSVHRMAAAYVDYMMRLVGGDLLKLQRRRSGFY